MKHDTENSEAYFPSHYLSLDREEDYWHFDKLIYNRQGNQPV